MRRGQDLFAVWSAEDFLHSRDVGEGRVGVEFAHAGSALRPSGVRDLYDETDRPGRSPGASDRLEDGAGRHLGAPDPVGKDHGHGRAGGDWSPVKLLRARVTGCRKVLLFVHWSRDRPAEKRCVLARRYVSVYLARHTRRAARRRAPNARHPRHHHLGRSLAHDRWPVLTSTRLLGEDVRQYHTHLEHRAPVPAPWMLKSGKGRTRKRGRRRGVRQARPRHAFDLRLLLPEGMDT